MHNTTVPIKRLVVVAVLILAALIGFFVYKTLQFHVVRTSPDLSSFSSIAPYMTIDFNRVVLEEDLEILDDPTEPIIDRQVVENKRVTIYFKKTLEPEVNYRLVLKQVSAIDGDKIIDKELAFKAKNLDVDGLTEAQQKYLVANQDQPIYEVPYLNYPGFDSLLEYGMASGQLEDLKQGLYDYSLSIDKQFYTMNLLPDSIVFNGRSRDNPTDFIKVDFIVELGGQPYKAHIEYQIEFDAVQLRVTAPDGAIYDSNNGGD